MIMAAFTAADRVNTRWLSERASDGGGGGGAAALVAGSLTSWREHWTLVAAISVTTDYQWEVGPQQL